MVNPSRRSLLASCGTVAAFFLAGCGYQGPTENDVSGPQRTETPSPTPAPEPQRTESPAPTPTPEVPCPSQTELEDHLPRFEGTPSPGDSSRPEALRDAIVDAITGCEWWTYAGYSKPSDDGHFVRIGATNATNANETLPDEWEGITIIVDETGEIELLLNE